MRTASLANCVEGVTNVVAPIRSGHLNRNIRRKAQHGWLILALGILHDAWPAAAADSQISRGSDEDLITDILRWKMVDAKNRRKPVPEMRFDRESQSDRPERDTQTGLIDIMVSYTWDESTYLSIECKRIRSSDNSLALQYVQNGINRFAAGKYSAGHSYGVMVGYVICGNSSACIERVRTTLSREPKEETGFDPKFGWQPAEGMIGDMPLFQTRHHQAQHGNTIELFHAFVALN